MNPNMQASNINPERPVNPAGNPGIRPVGMNPYTNPQQVRPIRMEPPRPVGNYQQNYAQQNQQQLQSNMPQFQQQNMMQQNQQRQFNLQQQQQNLRFPTNGDMVRPQTNPGYSPHPNSDIQNNQKGPGGSFEGQRLQMAPQVRPPGMQQQMRPPNYPNGTPLNQPNLQNYQRMESPRPPSDRIQANLQNAPHPQVPRDAVGNLSRKPSELEIKLPTMGNNNHRPTESSGKAISQNGNAPNAAFNDRKPDASAELISEIDENKVGESENSEDIKVAKTKQTKEKNDKENKNHGIKDETITTGMVKKNIKYFEESDTARTPLKPETVTVKKSKKPIEVPSDVVKSDINKNEYESGVDETPVVHPNLGSIFQVPRKVAKIPYLKGKKRSRRHKRHSEEPLHKNKILERPAFSVFLKSNHSYVPYKPGGKKIQNIKTYGSKEELLAFFENTKSWRKLHRYGSKTDQNATRDKIVHKPTTNGDIPTPKKTPSKLQTPSKKNPPLSPTKTPKSPGTPGTPGTPGGKSLPKTPESPAPPTPLIKKVPMNKIQVGAAPSPNLKTVRSKVGSLVNTTHKPGGGNVKIESHKIDLSKVQPRTEAKNEMYKPSGGEKKIQQVKLQWSAKSKIGSLENATYKPGGGDKKIESVKLDFKEKAKPKVGSKDNVKHVPGGGNVKIDNQKLEFKAQSKVGSLDNVKHKPGGGDIKIFDDKTYLRQISGNSSEGRASGTQAYNDLSIVREVEGRSAPGTPGRSTSVKIRKITTIENSGESPKIKNITKVTVMSHTSKKEKNSDKSPTNQQVKVTYSKIAAVKVEENEPPVGIVRLQANDNAPILKPSLSRKDLFDDPDIGKRKNENESRYDYDKTISNKNVRIAGNIKQNPASPNLHESKSNRDDSGMSKFLQDEMATQEKIGEMWRERNSIEVKPNPLNNRHQEGQQRDLGQTFFSENYEYGSNLRQFRPQNPGSMGDDPRRLNFHSSQNMQPDQVSINATFIQSQQQRQINQPSSFYPP